MINSGDIMLIARRTADFARQGKHRWMLSLTIGTTGESSAKCCRTDLDGMAAMVIGFFGRIGAGKSEKSGG